MKRTKYFLTLTFFLLSFSSFAKQMEVTYTLHPFSTDGCSSSPDGTIPLAGEQFLPCCKAHDVAYWKGGTAKERLKADQALRSCMEGMGHKNFAAIYYWTVRVFGVPMAPTTYRWGYGWEPKRGYGELRPEEKELADKMAPQNLEEVEITSPTREEYLRALGADADESDLLLY